MIKNIDLTKIIFIIVLLTFMNSTIYFISSNMKFKELRNNKEVINNIFVKEEEKFSEDAMMKLLVNLNIKFPHIVMAQAKLESSNFKSKIFIKNNNMFGMKVANIRPSTNLGSQNGHAYFKSWTDCVLDYALYQAAYLNRIKSEKEYYQYLSNNYAEDKRYVKKVKEIAEQIK